MIAKKPQYRPSYTRPTKMSSTSAYKSDVSPVQSDHGSFGSLYNADGVGLTLTQAMYEKLDNIIDAHKRKRKGTKKTAIYIETFHNGHGVIRDNLPMSQQDMSNFRVMFRKPNNVNNNIGKHGLGGKIADYTLSKQGRTIIVSKENDLCHVLIFDWANMKKAYDRNNEDIYKDNISLKHYRHNDIIEVIEENYNFSYACIQQIQTHLIKPGTLVYYEDLNFKERISTVSAKDIGRTYYKVLKNGKIDLYFEGRKIDPFDVMYKEELEELEGDAVVAHDYYHSHELRVAYHNDCFYIDSNDLTDITNKKQYFKWNKRTKRHSCAKNLPLGKVWKGAITIEMSCLWPIETYCPENKGVYINRCGKYLTTIPTTRNEYCAFRVQMSYDETQLDELFNPGINKGSAQLTSTIKTLGIDVLKGFRKTFPETKTKWDANFQRTTECIHVVPGASDGLEVEVGAPGEASDGLELEVGAPGEGSDGLGLEVGAPGEASDGLELEVGAPGEASDGLGLEVGAPGEASDGLEVEVGAPGEASDVLELEVGSTGDALCTMNTYNVTAHTRDVRSWPNMTRTEMYKELKNMVRSIDRKFKEGDNEKKLVSSRYMEALDIIKQKLLWI